MTISLLLVLAACGGSSTDVQTQSEGGTYHLVTVNGQSLPATVTTTSGTVSIQSATVVLTPGTTQSTYTASMTGAIGAASSSTLVSDAGTYVRSGSSLTFTSSSVPIPFAGTINSNGHIVVALPGAAIGAPITVQLELAKS